MNPNVILLIVLEVLDILAAGARLLPEAEARLSALRAKLEQFLTEGRDPTVEELSELMSETTRIHAGIQGSGDA